MKTNIEAALDNTWVSDPWEVLIQQATALRRVPSATYRLQFNRSFTFEQARRIVPYLYDLGVTDCYASPYLKAPPESEHGYDICDHSQLNPAIGTEEDYDRFVAALWRHGMGQILDVVPNHMGIARNGNRLWLDVLENGHSSPYAVFFDIDWKPLNPGVELENRLLLPILGDAYGKVLENQELVLSYEDGAFFVTYHETKLPLAARTYTEILSYAADLLDGSDGHEEGATELRSIITALSHLPLSTEDDPDKLAEGRREKEVTRRRLLSLHDSCSTMAAAIAEAVRVFNGTKGAPRSFDRLDALLDAQAYRLAYWRVAAEEINYRRFFEVNELAAIRMEVPEVFHETHRLILRLLVERRITGLRVDHPDGLLDPAGYLQQVGLNYLWMLYRRNTGPQGEHALEEPPAPDAAWLARYEEEIAKDPHGPLAFPLYVIVEKILSGKETLPENWPVFGTTGYDFTNTVNGLFVDGAARKAFDQIYASFTGSQISFPNLVNGSKKMIMLVSLVSEINMLGYQLKRMSAKNRLYRDFTLNGLTFAIREVIAGLPVYRTYITKDSAGVDPRDQVYIEAAIAEAKRRNPRTAATIFDFIGDILLMKGWDDLNEQERAERSDFVLKFQQNTGAVMAKGLEDTAFYIYNRLVSLNEVGGDPTQFGISVADFHQHNVERQRHWPHSLSSTSTHDTKRSEDVRARINVLTEIPREWRTALARWSRLNERHRSPVDGRLAPDRNEEYLLYQTLLGTWPEMPADDETYRNYRTRIEAYLLKAIREAKVNTSWINPNIAHEEAVKRFVRAILEPGKNNPFLRNFAKLQPKVSHFGVYNSLSQTVLKITSPGVPDFYQGNEIWNFSLVDPDNRRPVDYTKRVVMLKQLRRRIAQLGSNLIELAQELEATKEDGRIKLFVTYQGLNYRHDHPQLFAAGTYVPLKAEGSKAEHVCAFARVLDQEAAMVIVPRLPLRLTNGSISSPAGAAVWQDTVVDLPDGEGECAYRNVFTGEVLHPVYQEGHAALFLGQALAHFPVAILERFAI